MTRSNSQVRFREIELSEIDRSRNHRIQRFGDAERLEKLKLSIQACGTILQPIRVYERGEDQKDKKHREPYLLGYGNRRCVAMEQLGHQKIPAMIFPPASYAEIAQARAIENINRQDITPLEEVLAVAEVMEGIKADPTFMGDIYEEAAARLGCDLTWVKDRDYLDRLSKPVQQFALRSGLPLGHLREITKVGDPVEQMRLACEAAGAPAHAFPAEPKGKLEEWQKKLQDLYFAELTDGKIHRWPLTRLKDQVAKLQFSLKVVPWEFDQPVQFGDVKLRKCAGCPHNSETDRTLFEIEEDAANPKGICLNPSCFSAKHEVTQAAKEQVFKKVKDRKDQSPAVIRQIAPEWLKETTVIGFVKRQLDKAAAGETPAPKPKTSSTGGRPLTEHETALSTFSDAFHSWEAKAYKAVLRGINADPAYRISWCVLLGVSAFWEHPHVSIPHVNPYSEPITQEPVLPEFPPELESVIQTAFKGGRSAWAELLKDEEQPNPDHRRGLGTPHPKALELLAQLVKVTLKPMPEWKAVGPPSASQSDTTSQVTEAVAT